MDVNHIHIQKTGVSRPCSPLRPPLGEPGRPGEGWRCLLLVGGGVSKLFIGNSGLEHQNKGKYMLDVLAALSS